MREVSVQLTDKEKVLLKDVIDCYIEGIDAAKDLTTTDGTVGSAEQLLDLMSGYDEDRATLVRIKEQLCG